MADWRKLFGEETVDISHLLTNVTGSAWLTRSGKTRVLRLIDVEPTTLANGGTLLHLESRDRPAYRVDERWWARPPSTNPADPLPPMRSAFVIPQGPVGVWSPSTSDQYRLTLTWGVA